jgi:prevent-host-death family protein
MYSIVSARQIQREYKKILEKANKNNEPIIIMANNKPQGAVIGLDLLEKIQLDTALREALEEFKDGKTLTIINMGGLEKYLEDISKES